VTAVGNHSQQLHSAIVQLPAAAET